MLGGATILAAARLCQAIKKNSLGIVQWEPRELAISGDLLGLNGDLMGLNGDLKGLNGDLMGLNGDLI